MCDDPHRRPFDGRDNNESLRSQARRWLRAQVDRLGRDPDLVPLMPRDEVEQALPPGDLSALSARTREHLDDHPSAF